MLVEGGQSYNFPFCCTIEMASLLQDSSHYGEEVSLAILESGLARVAVEDVRAYPLVHHENQDGSRRDCTNMQFDNSWCGLSLRLNIGMIEVNLGSSRGLGVCTCDALHKVWWSQLR